MTRLFRRLRRNERGAVLVMTVPVLLLALTCTALSVDIGRQLAEKRSDQSIADMAALDAARAMGQLDPAAAPSTIAATAQTAAVASATRNSFGTAPSENVQAVVGSLDPTTNSFTAAGQSAVQVTITSVTDYMFAPGSKTVAARAVANVGTPDAEFSVGSTLASLDTKRSRLDPMLSPMLGGGSLGAVSYDGLATGNVSLRILQQKLLAMGLDVGTTEKLMNTNVKVVDLLTATGQALGQQGQPTAQAEITDLLNASLSTTNTVAIGRFVKLAQPTSTAALDATVNVFRLVAASAEAASGSSFVSVPLAGITIPGVTGVTLKAKVIEPAQTAIGPVGTTARNSQVTLRVTMDVPLGFLLPTAAVTLDYTSANAEALLTAIRCGAASSPGMTLNASTSAVAVSGSGTVPAGSFAIWSTVAGIAPAANTFAYPSEFAPYSRHIGVATVGLNTTSLNVTGTVGVAALAPVLQGLLPTTLATINTAISPAIQPLLASLGLNISAADLTAISVLPAVATCGGAPRLVK